ncbi:protein ORF56 [Goose adenovirus 4]|nr:protein ORF56 [Goose adenovirus 4]
MKSLLVLTLLCLFTQESSLRVQNYVYESDNITIDCGMYKYCHLTHWRFGKHHKIFVIEKGVGRVPKHSFQMRLKSLEPPTLELMNLTVKQSGMYQCICEDIIGIESTSEIYITVRRRENWNPSDHEDPMPCDASSCSSCIFGLFIPLISVAFMIMMVFVFMCVYFNRFRLIYNCSKLRC